MQYQMSGISIGHSHPRPCPGKKTLRRCRNNEEADNVILIDVDSENFDNVIIIDIPESLPKKKPGSSRLRKDKKCSFRNVINIDDDETPDSSHSIGVNNVSFSAGTSSNRESCRVSKNFGDSADAAVEDCQFDQDNGTPVRLSKCKRTYSGKASTRNRYGLDTDSECDSSDNDYPDCELVEDSSGKVQELWEKAFSRRKKDIRTGHSGIRDHDSTSRCINRDYHQNAESKDPTRQHKEASFRCTTGKSNNENDVSSPFRTKEDTDFGCTHLSDNALHDRQYDKSDALGKSNSQAKFCPSIHAEQANCPDCEPGSSGSHIEERRKDPASSNFAFQEESNKKFDHPVPTVEEEETSKIEPCPPKFESHVDLDSCNGKSSPIEGEATIRKSKNSFETEVNQGRYFPGDSHKNFQETASGSVEEREHLESRQSHATEGAKEMENLMPERCSFKSSALPDKQIDLSSTPSCGAVGSVSGKSLFSKSFLSSGEDKKGYHKEKRPLVPEIPLLERIHLNEAKLREDDSVSNIQRQEDNDGQLHSQNGDTLPPAETCIINEREKLKETDEYKRAIEEEWASRKQALLIQVYNFFCFDFLEKYFQGRTDLY